MAVALPPAHVPIVLPVPPGAVKVMPRWAEEVRKLSCCLSHGERPVFLRGEVKDLFFFPPCCAEKLRKEAKMEDEPPRVIFTPKDWASEGPNYPELLRNH